MSETENINKIQQRIEKVFKLLSPADYYHPACPRNSAPKKPHEPNPTIHKWETHKDMGSCLDLSELVDFSLAKAGIDPERLPEDIRQALLKTTVECYRGYHDDYSVLKVEWDNQTPNPKYEEQHAEYLVKLAEYEIAYEEHAKQMESFANERIHARAKEQDQKDREDYERLKQKFGHK